MRRSDYTLIFSLFLALGVCLVAYWAGMGAVRRGLGWNLSLPRFEREPDDAARNVQKPRAPAEPLLPMIVFGDANGTGHGINSAPGERDLMSTLSDPEQDQALMRRDAFGNTNVHRQTSLADAIGLEPARPAATKDAAQNAQLEKSTTPIAPRAAEDHALPRSKPAAATVKSADQSAVNVDPIARLVKSIEMPHKPAPPQNKDVAKDASAPPEAAKEPRAQNSSSAANSPPHAAADGTPTDKGDFESVPVTIARAIEFDGSRVIAQKGRKILTRRLPDLTLAGWDDLRFVSRPEVDLELVIDETGNVIDARIARGTGSDSIDLPCQRAVETWWFEPAKDPVTGKPLHREKFLFVIRFI